MYQIKPLSRRSTSAGAIVAAIATLAIACQSTTPTPRPTGAVPAATGEPPATALAPTSAGPVPSSGPTATVTPDLIPQPPPPVGLNVAPESARVDLAMPVFSNPTEITNPLFPVSSQASVLMLGHVDGLPFRTEVTLLPATRILEWQGQRVETLISQYNAFLDGRITEIAFDYYAQADDGSVWYFGEDVYDFADGNINSTEGTWLAGRDAPAAMIMPGTPKVGDVYRPENAPDFVFEEVTVVATDLTLDGPLGPIAGGLAILELHSDGSTEDKLFAPGYGEFLTGGGGDLEALALGVPTDAVGGPMPAELSALGEGALRVFDHAGAGMWAKAATGVAAVETAWSGLPKDIVPLPIRQLLTDQIAHLGDAVGVHRARAARNAAIEVARLAYDVQLRYRPVPEIDLARADLWAAQILVDAAAGNSAGVAADVFALDYLRDRLAALDPAVVTRINIQLGAMQGGILDGDSDAIVAAAIDLRILLAELLPGS